MTGSSPRSAAMTRSSSAISSIATEGYFGVGIDAVSALDAWGNGNPGFDAMDLGYLPYRTMSASARRSLNDPDPNIFHFPDGNAGLARAPS